LDGPENLQVTSHVTTEPVDDELLSASVGVRLATLLSVVVPFLGLLVAVSLLWDWGLGWWHLGLFLGMFVLTGAGITVGFHRLFTHRSFETNSAVQFLLNSSPEERQ
jgi:stearoyl-CoA desaturase (delta-9 desaturase)